MVDKSRYPTLYGAAPSATTSSSSYVYPVPGVRGNSVRAREIEELKRTVPNCVPKNSSQVLWELEAVTHEQQVVHLRISIPTAYPEEPPTVSVLEYQTLNHVWVDRDTGDMTLPSKGSTLSEIVTIAYEALSGRAYTPPPVPPPVPPPFSPYSSSPYMPSPSLRPPAGGREGAQQARVRAKLEALSAAELAGLVCDPEKFAAFLQPWLQESEAGQRAARTRKALVTAAKQNKGIIDEYANTQQQIQVTRASELSPAEQQYNELITRQAAVLSKLDVSSMLSSMREECDKWGESSDVLDKEFMSSTNSDAKTSAFVSSFLDQRIRYHTLKIKLDAAQNLLQIG